jgi:hypothetical protein
MFVLAAALLLTGAGDAGPGRPPADPAQRRVCRVQEVLGSITPHRVCRTVSEWAQLDAAQARTTQRNLDHMNNHPASSNSPGE